MSAERSAESQCPLCKEDLKEGRCPKCGYQIVGCQPVEIVPRKPVHRTFPPVEIVPRKPVDRTFPLASDLLDALKEVDAQRLVCDSSASDWIARVAVPAEMEVIREKKWNCAICGGKITYKETVTFFGNHEIPIPEFATVGSLVHPMSLFGLHNTEAAVTKKHAEEKLSAATKGLDRVKWKIVCRIHETGGFYSKGTVGFWNGFTEELCGECCEKLVKIGQIREQAKALLEEARKLDPDNEAVKKNLEAISS